MQHKNVLLPVFIDYRVAEIMSGSSVGHQLTHKFYSQ